ncbi:hypothetical protein FN846DRAFT_528564 [Sphaerosporella brunnea]|uniref:Uncharacterized protein n=1 Tax=Sphaerosporella brunnea TaxID=1250544 RepID=A0A5J5EDW4_9PEZI|nr:hypothetical protein FN846DRAFT_528564 [Sphaerosporella brunnea]
MSTTPDPTQRVQHIMPTSAKGSQRTSPAPIHSATNSGPSTPLPGRVSSRPSTRRSTPVRTSGAAPTTASPKSQPSTQGASAELSDDMLVPPPPHGKPSYREYDDKAAPSLVTASMHPLGDMPSAKALEATKRPYAFQPKKKTKGKAGANGNSAAGRDGRPGQAGQAKTTTPSATNTAPPSDVSARTSGSPSAPASQVATPKPPPPNPWINGNAPSSKTPQGRQRLSLVVEAAVHRSTITGNGDMGRAIKKLYQESLANEGLAELLDAVLAQKATPEQFQYFQTIARQAREAPDTSDADAPMSTEQAGGEISMEQVDVNNEAKPTSEVVNGKAENGNIASISQSKLHEAGKVLNALHQVLSLRPRTPVKTMQYLLCKKPLHLLLLLLLRLLLLLLLLRSRSIHPSAQSCPLMRN